jgi:hypothetical protein
MTKLIYTNLNTKCSSTIVMEVIWWYCLQPQTHQVQRSSGIQVPSPSIVSHEPARPRLFHQQSYICGTAQWCTVRCQHLNHRSHCSRHPTDLYRFIIEIHILQMICKCSNHRTDRVYWLPHSPSHDQQWVGPQASHWIPRTHQWQSATMWPSLAISSSAHQWKVLTSVHQQIQP